MNRRNIITEELQEVAYFPGKTTKYLHNITKHIFSFIAFLTLLLLFTGCVFDSIHTVNGGDAASGKTIQVTVGMPEDTPQTRISHEQDGLTVRIAWQEGDKIDLLVVHGGEKTAYRGVPVTVDGTNNKKATFPLTLPGGTYETFDLYGVYGGGGLDATDP
ncbi:MAG: hypothetical protein GX281_01795 [Bacteroidales bacterium]|jgi:hypothetical protein|nr:hypothetical protein [Bacteroidales bacterium]NLK79445.1 hypothetical protein [Bacteroidales bacterium]HKM30725.1 hypothetical protein [Bacteroidales bacterium]HPX79514.1 hypothetical protein [Bacteroidales bacterium]HQB23393.1 hypothetical protein [Bacteroidales bacterium]